MALQHVLTCFVMVAMAGSAATWAEEAVSPRIEALRGAAPEQRAAAVTDFWGAIEKSGTPLVEAVDGGRIRVTFIWRAPPTETESNIGLIGSFVPGGSRELVKLARIPGTDVMHKAFVLDERVRYRYYFAWPEGRHSDPRRISPLTLDGLSYELFDDAHSALSFLDDDFTGKAIRTSYFEGPNAPAEPWLAPRDAVAKGKVETFDASSRLLGNVRKVSIYTPANYGARSSGYPYIVLFDREAYLQSVPTATILDNLIATGDIAPLVAIFVSSIDETHRDTELRPNPRFGSFIVDELLPQVRKRWHLSRDPRHAIIGGSSLGGLASANIARLHPQVFGNVLSMSGSYWWHPEDGEDLDEALSGPQNGWLPQEYASAARLPLRLYVCVGLGEGEGMLAPNRLFRDVLTAKGYSLRYEEYHGDHSYLNWRESLVAGLGFLLRRSVHE